MANSGNGPISIAASRLRHVQNVQMPSIIQHGAADERTAGTGADSFNALSRRCCRSICTSTCARACHQRAACWRTPSSNLDWFSAMRRYACGRMSTPARGGDRALAAGLPHRPGADRRKSTCAGFADAVPSLKPAPRRWWGLWPITYAPPGLLRLASPPPCCSSPGSGSASSQYIRRTNKRRRLARPARRRTAFRSPCRSPRPLLVAAFFAFPIVHALVTPTSSLAPSPGPTGSAAPDAFLAGAAGRGCTARWLSRSPMSSGRTPCRSIACSARWPAPSTWRAAPALLTRLAARLTFGLLASLGLDPTLLRLCRTTASTRAFSVYLWLA